MQRNYQGWSIWSLTIHDKVVTGSGTNISDHAGSVPCRARSYTSCAWPVRWHSRSSQAMSDMWRAIRAILRCFSDVLGNIRYKSCQVSYVTSQIRSSCAGYVTLQYINIKISQRYISDNDSVFMLQCPCVCLFVFPIHVTF